MDERYLMDLIVDVTKHPQLKLHFQNIQTQSGKRSTEDIIVFLKQVLMTGGMTQSQVSSVQNMTNSHPELIGIPLV